MSAVASRIDPVLVPEAVHDDPGDRPCDGWGRRHDGRAGECCCRAVGHVVWLTEDWSRVETRSACGRHLAIARAAGGCLTFAYGCLPPPSTLMPLINAEIARRQQQPWSRDWVDQQPRWRSQAYYPGASYTSNLGGQRWTINFGTP